MLTLLASGCGASDPRADVRALEPCNGQGRARCVAQVSLGAHFGCALLGNESVWCWGRNDESQLGFASTETCTVREGSAMESIACQLYPRQAATVAPARAITTGAHHACALDAQGAVQCWGSNTFGQLGNGATLSSTNASAVRELRGASAIAAGGAHTCAIVNGSVWCWGLNDRGQLGSTARDERCNTVAEELFPCARVPVRSLSITDAVELAAGDAHTCARIANGRVFCWGSNDDGQLGTGEASATPAPFARAVTLGREELSDVIAITAGASHTCALRRDNAVLCWGRNDRGQLGVQAAPPPFAPCAHECVESPVTVTGFTGAAPIEDTDVVNIDADPVAQDGGASDAQRDAVGPDGDAMDASAAPIDDAAVRPGVRAIGLAAAAASTCILADDGTVRCFGANSLGELGNGRRDPGGYEPTVVIAGPGASPSNPLQPARAISAGGASACAVLSDRSLRCWGNNTFGTLAIGTVDEQLGPVATTW